MLSESQKAAQSAVSSRGHSRKCCVQNTNQYVAIGSQANHWLSDTTPTKIKQNTKPHSICTAVLISIRDRLLMPGATWACSDTGTNIGAKWITEDHRDNWWTAESDPAWMLMHMHKLWLCSVLKGDHCTVSYSEGKNILQRLWCTPIESKRCPLPDTLRVIQVAHTFYLNISTVKSSWCGGPTLQIVAVYTILSNHQHCETNRLKNTIQHKSGVYILILKCSCTVRGHTACSFIKMCRK